MVTIEGSNLGRRREDVEGKVRIGNLPCVIVEYHVSVRIVCKTHAANSEMSVPITVGNSAGDTRSLVEFNYRVSKQNCSVGRLNKMASIHFTFDKFDIR